ncbi:kinesin heavy chain-like protein, putative [Eimeria tenella]|uniref:Kinesin-like protein n=1 Tax=Eimeria tenella TaxID=5802 RepID=U6KMY6_EIMTE|nr:kinesin heavy chain-like protein, putative [Eimeria tenella]CDJ38191.1 kinesin heavy chain-like protein, putative [Eimeria tenella]|eukprot:XP_013229029.1 kinesin heavy chain-like protein, putative [Eimeria tenella]
MQKQSERADKAEAEAERTKNELKDLQKKFDEVSKEMTELKKQVEDVQSMAAELQQLRQMTAQQITQIKELETSYQAEKKLRKKYYNEIEDMKGKIRVYCRIRPFAKYEKEKGSLESVQALDEYSVKVTTNKEEVYEDTERLIQSVIDGFNLVDLLAPPEVKKNPPSLDIKKDSNGIVTIQGITMKKVTSAESLEKIFEFGLASRHVSGTAMNAESSRSHLIFAIVVRIEDLIAEKVTFGKLSLIDLAGSERVSKSGVTKERLVEAKEINKSLTALGDVISALSSGESFIPYRNHKLTQLMSDSLGGTAKTLMFVNISPADYNVEETVTSLMYAARVKLITNEVTAAAAAAAAVVVQQQRQREL